MESTLEIPHRGSRPALAPPEIYIHDISPPDRFRSPGRSTSYGASYKSPAFPTTPSIAMPIPNARPQPPPALPPPRHLDDVAHAGRHGGDLASQFGSHHDGRESRISVLSVASGSSLYGSFTSAKSTMDDRPDFDRRGSSASTIKSLSGDGGREILFPRIDEGYASLTSVGSNKSNIYEPSPLKYGFQSSVHDTYRDTGQAYDKSLLQKLNSRRGSDNTTPPRGSVKSSLSTSASDASPTSWMVPEHRYPTQLKPLSHPIISTRNDCAAGSWTDSPKDAYPRFGGLGLGYRSPNELRESERSPLPFAKRSGSGSALGVDDTARLGSRTRDGYERRVSPENDVDFPMEEAGFRRLHIEDPGRADTYSPSSTVGQKRRASSPPRGDGPSLHVVGSASELYRRRESASRNSPGPRFHSTTGSVSSTASGPRSGSYASTSSLTASSLSSYGRLSPGGLSPGGATDSSDSPYVTSNSLNPSPRSSISRPTHHRALSETRPLITSRKPTDGTAALKHRGGPKIHGVFMCECCPKKPKKFDSLEELNAHEQEKQYECAYCRNRFKNKNEAERHQNSLHLRRHSWSCAALSGYAAAFHPSPTSPNDADTCGFCGDEFPRSGISPNGVPYATEQDWELRIAHLQESHKFGECNHAKKFFRADHFRQHLKHSHAGTSGKWTNMLENACMKDEPLPEPINRGGSTHGGVIVVVGGVESLSPGGGDGAGAGGAGERVGRISEEEEGL